MVENKKQLNKLTYNGWKSRKLWVFIGLSSYYSILTTVLLWKTKIGAVVWKDINTMVLTVGFSVFVLGNLAEHFINRNNKNG